MWVSLSSVYVKFCICTVGEGTFGKVLQAKAEGIVESTPERNIVAVKTVKGDCIKHVWSMANG